MRSFKLLENRARYVVAAVGLFALGVVAPVVSAAQITERSIELSSSVKEVENVDYKFTFNATTLPAGAVVVQFCSNTPLIGEFCNAPVGFDASGATATGATISGTPTANQVLVTKTIASGVNTFTLSGITNPTNTGALYARVLTYTDTTAAAAYVVDDDSSALGSPLDQGSVALYINEGVNVSGAVLETMTFCVSGGTEADPEVNPIGANCSGTLTAPTLRLGQDVGGVIALDSQNVSEGTIFTQLSTNAAKGAIISLKSNAINCGGLLRSSDLTACNIGPAGVGPTDDIVAGQAEFGIKLGADVTDATNGDLVAASTNYNSTNFRLNYVAGNATGVTSTYGDPILDTNEEPANNRDMPITFGASVSNNTPAGNYSADMSLVATGKF